MSWKDDWVGEELHVCMVKRLRVVILEVDLKELGRSQLRQIWAIWRLKKEDLLVFEDQSCYREEQQANVSDNLLFRSSLDISEKAIADIVHEGVW